MNSMLVGLHPTEDVMRSAARIASDGWEVGPRLNPCVCGKPWHLHVNGAPAGCPGYQHDPADALAQVACWADSRSAMDDVADHNRAVRKQRTAGRWQVSPSDVGSCRRQLWYRENPPPGYVPLRQNTRKADAGTAMHAGITEARAALYPWRKHKVLVPIPGLDRDGEADEYDPITATVEDWKTAGHRAWEQIGLHGPYERAWRQAFIYAYALECAGYEVRRVRIRYIHRETGDEETFTRPYDQQYALESLGELVNLVTMLDAGIEPEREGRGPGVDPMCDFCPARAHCWQMDAADAAARSPQTFVAFGAEPDPSDPDVLWAVEQAGQARQRRLAAEKAEMAAKALADVDAGVYGDWEVRRGTIRRPDYRGAYERLIAALEDREALPPDERPSLSRLLDRPVPVNVSSTLTITPVRKATKEQPVPIAVGKGVA